VAKEARHLASTRRRLFVTEIDDAWVKALQEDEILAERVEAFASRFGRLQDTLGEKLLPRMAALAGRRPAALVELLVAAEKLGWIESADRWLEWRKLRNRLVPEYMNDPAQFAQALNEADCASSELLEAEKHIRAHAVRLGMLARAA
jgi:hypothetical protein